jgi:hypothetical protein
MPFSRSPFIKNVLYISIIAERVTYHHFGEKREFYTADRKEQELDKYETLCYNIGATKVCVSAYSSHCYCGNQVSRLRTLFFKIKKPEL